MEASGSGGSYLRARLTMAALFDQMTDRTYRTHMTKTPYLRTGTTTFSPKTSANLSKARPLLVVHSGNTTTGPLADCLISSSDLGSTPLSEGVPPIVRIISHRVAVRKPRMLVRGRAEGVEMFAEPVPVLRPGADVGDVRRVAGSISSGMGRTNVGLNLRTGSC